MSGVDWLGFAYAIVIAIGGVMGYTDEGSLLSLIGGIAFGAIEIYGALRASLDPPDHSMQLFSSLIFTFIAAFGYFKNKRAIPECVYFALSLAMLFRACLNFSIPIIFNPATLSVSHQSIVP